MEQPEVARTAIGRATPGLGVVAGERTLLLESGLMGMPSMETEPTRESFPLRVSPSRLRRPRSMLAAAPLVPYPPSISSSSSHTRSFRRLEIIHTPQKVSAHPMQNFNMRSGLTASKSRYRIALPKITDIVKKTNCVGITCVESKRCRARLTYLIWSMAVRKRTMIKR